MNMTKPVQRTKQSEPHSDITFLDDPQYAFRAERAMRHFQELRRKVQDIYTNWDPTNYMVNQSDSMPYISPR